MDNEAVAVAVDVGGRVGLELDGDVGGGGVELEASFGSSVLTQDFSREVVSVVKGHQVVRPDVQPETRRVNLSLFSSVSCCSFLFSMNTNQPEANCAAPPSLSALVGFIFKLSLAADEQVGSFSSRGAG